MGKRGKPLSTYAPSDWRLKKILPSYEHYQEWIEGEKGVSLAYRRSFNRSERLILFCRVACSWSYRVTSAKTGISRYQVERLYEKIRNWI